MENDMTNDVTANVDLENPLNGFWWTSNVVFNNTIQLFINNNANSRKILICIN